MGAIQEITFYPINIPGKSLLNSDYLVVSKTDLNDGIEEMYAWSPVRYSVCSFYKPYGVLFARSTNCTKFCSFVLQTLRRSVRSFYKPYDVLFVRSTNPPTFCSFVLQTLRSSVRSFYKLFEVLFVRSTNPTTFCSFVLQTLRSSVRSLYKLYEALFVCSTSSTFVLCVWSSSERYYDQYDRYTVSTIVVRTDGSSTRVARTDLVY